MSMPDCFTPPNLRSFFQDKPSSWPKRCPDNYSKHLATIDGGCQIDYCVQTGALAGPVLPPVMFKIII